MLKSLFTAIGGGIKDIQVAVVNTAEYVVDEISSIPDALSDGYDTGILSADEEPIEANAVTPVPDKTEASKEVTQERPFPTQPQ